MSGSLITAFLAQESLLHTGQSLGLPTHNPRQEPQNVEIMVNACITLHNMLRTAGADDAGCWSWYTQQSASVGIYSHVLVSKGKRW